MNPVYVPLLSALAGALIGASASIFGVLIQAKISDRRERVRQAATLAMEDLKLRLTRGASGTVLPMPVYVHYQLAVLSASKKNKLTPERLREIAAETRALADAMREIEAQVQPNKTKP